MENEKSDITNQKGSESSGEVNSDSSTADKQRNIRPNYKRKPRKNYQPKKRGITAKNKLHIVQHLFIQGFIYAVF